MRLVSILFTLFLFSCSGIKPINGPRKDLYRKEFVAKLDQVKKVYKSGQFAKALSMMNAMADGDLEPAEVPLKYNLIGVIKFQKGDYEQSVQDFLKAMNLAQQDPYISSKIRLNLMSSYFRLKKYELANDIQKSINARNLSDVEKKKLYNIQFLVAVELKDKPAQVHALVNYFSAYTEMGEVETSNYFAKLKAAYKELSPDQRGKILTEYESQLNYAVALLAFNEIDKAYFEGNSDRVESLLDWVEGQYSDNTIIQEKVKLYLNRLATQSIINTQNIGVVLPLSGPKAKFGKRALVAISEGLKKFFPEGKRPSLHVRDSASVGAIGAHEIKQLILKQNVAAVIGGLFSTEAVEQYQQARKLGVLFISLSSVYVPKREKGHLLLEVTGSVESQLDHVFSSEFLNHFGRKIAFIYPQSDRGKIYMDAFWEKAQEAIDIKVTGIQTYKKNSKDYRTPVERILGVRYRRERQEELDMMEQVYSAQGHTSIRRVQKLDPIIDFDWIYLPAYPSEAIQLIPSFSYFDALKINFVGGPSWNSKGFMKQVFNMGKVHTIGNSFAYSPEDKEEYKKNNSYSLGVVEVLSWDAVHVLKEILLDKTYAKRVDLERYIVEKGSLLGVKGQWTLKDKFWIKKMSALRLKRNSAVNVNYESTTKTIEQVQSI